MKDKMEKKKKSMDDLFFIDLVNSPSFYHGLDCLLVPEPELTTQTRFLSAGGRFNAYVCTNVCDPPEDLYYTLQSREEGKSKGGEERRSQSRNTE
jgi:hypothetical protein